MTNRLHEAIGNMNPHDPGRLDLTPEQTAALGYLRMVGDEAESLHWLSERRKWHGQTPATGGNVPRPAVKLAHAVAVLELDDGTTEVVWLPVDPTNAGQDLGTLADWCNPKRTAKREQLNRLTDATIATLEAKVAEAERKAERAEVVADALADLYGAGDVRAAAAAVADRMLPEPSDPTAWNDPNADPKHDVEAALREVKARHGEYDAPDLADHFDPGPTQPPKPGHVT